MKNYYNVFDMLLATLAGAGILMLGLNVTHHFETVEEPTCEQVRLEIKALEQCLKFRPTCEAVTTEDFVQFYKQKDWISANCPKSGDGSLSRSTE